jgi:hypothetical protein
MMQVVSNCKCCDKSPSINDKGLCQSCQDAHKEECRIDNCWYCYQIQKKLEIVACVDCGNVGDCICDLVDDNTDDEGDLDDCEDPDYIADMKADRQIQEWKDGERAINGRYRGGRRNA